MSNNDGTKHPTRIEQDAINTAMMNLRIARDLVEKYLPVGKEYKDAILNPLKAAEKALQNVNSANPPSMWEQPIPPKVWTGSYPSKIGIQDKDQE